MNMKHLKHIFTLLAVLVVLLVILFTTRQCMSARPSPLDTSQGGTLGYLLFLLNLDDDQDGSILAVGVGDSNALYTAQLSGGGAGQWSTSDLSGIASLDFKSVAWTGQRFVAVGGDGSSCAIYHSGDGVSWTYASHPSCSSNLLDVTAGNGLAVAVGYLTGGVPGVQVSADHGLTWTEYTGMDTAAYVKLVFDGTYFIAANNSGGITETYRSTDGQSWAQTPDNTPLGSAYPATYSALHRVPGTSRVIIAGTDGNMITPNPATSVTSTDHIVSCTNNATAVFGGVTTSHVMGLASGSGMLVAVGEDCGLDYTQDVSGLSWVGGFMTMTNCPASTNWQGLVYVNGAFIAVGEVAGSSGIVGVSTTGYPGEWQFQTVGSQIINDVAVRQ